MEFFERAHVVKNKSSKKITKNKKKQLKQMLYGYKVSDNKLIHNSTDTLNDYDDSTSVSGFSDLNLTTSSSEDNIGPFTLNKSNSVSDTSINSNIPLVTNSNSYEKNSSCELPISECNISYENNQINEAADLPLKFPDNDNYKDITSSSDNSVTECDENDESLDSYDNNDVIDEEVSSFCDSKASLDASIFSSSTSGTAEVFDADGQLADKIQQRLTNTKLQLQNNIQRSKRKYEELDGDCSIVNGSTSKERSKRSQTDLKTKHQFSDNQESDCSTNSDSKPITSPSYVSVTAEDMQSQNFCEILGEYNYSTIKGIPQQKQDILFSSGNKPFVIEGNMSMTVQTEEPMGSSNPEPNNITKIEDIEESGLNPEITIGTLDISTDKNTIESESIEKEVLLETDYDKLYKIYYGSKCCVIILKHPCELFIQGKMKIRAIGGTVELFGYVLKEETYNVYAPYYNFSQCIKTVENQNVYYGLFGKLTGAGLSTFEAEDIVTSIGEYDGIIILQELKTKLMDFVDNNFKICNLFTKSNKIVEPYFIKASNIIKCSLFSYQSSISFKMHPDWNEAIKLAEDKYCRGIVCGGKNSGKSTYLRYQVNKLLSHGPVLVLDLDPGQSEFTVAGNISATVVTGPLFGPSFTHLKKPKVSLNIGMINTTDNTKRYVNAVRTLITYCRNNQSFTNMPWIVNTMGMTNSIGLKFMTVIISLTQPTFVLQYESKNIKHRFETMLTPDNVKMLYQTYRNHQLFENIHCPKDLEYSIVVAHNTDGSVRNINALRPKDERYLSFLVYFTHLLQIYHQDTLLGVTPYEVCLKDLCIITNVNVKEDYISKVINGKVVALCQHERQCDSARVFTLADKPLLCHGHGLVRGIDWEKEILYVITPVPSSELGNVDSLLYADWLPDLVGLESELPIGTTVPYRTTTEHSYKQLMSTPARRFNPLQLIKMSRNS